MYFTDIATIKRIVRISNELTDSEITEFIEFTDQDIIADYGRSTQKVASKIESTRTTYYINNEPDINAYKIDYVSADGSFLAPFVDTSGSDVMGTGSYEFGSGSHDNKILLHATDVTTYEDKDIEVAYVPEIMHNLATFMASFDLIQSMHIVTAGAEGEHPRTAWLKQRIEQIQSEIQDRYVVDKNFKAGITYLDQDYLQNSP